MEISVVTGTYNRLESLLRMVKSVREHCPVPYDIVVVDGGSTDGTIQWCQKQPDIDIIEHGELKGAIRAFCDGGNAAQGRYTLLLNDDVELLPGALMAAYTYLETHPTCGQVAFMDDRPQAGRPAGAFRAQTMPALKDGVARQVVYGQVAMMPTDLGKQLGWWGADDPVMGKARTYGGDNYLSAKVWELGLSVDVVRGAMVKDHHLHDKLRSINQGANDKAYRERYPEGPVIGDTPGDVQDRERIRILYLPIYDPDAAEVQRVHRHGLRDALAKRGVVWEWDYLDVEGGVHIEDITGFAPHIVLTQFHDPRWKELIANLKDCAPDSLFINWNGDARGLVTTEYLDMLKLIDLQLVVNAAALGIYEVEGIPAAYWQIGWEPRGKLPKVEAFDVIFMGNCYSEQRREMEKMLRTIPDIKVGLFGYGWQEGKGVTLYDFTTGAALYGKCKIAISDTFSDGKTDVHAFASNRFFEALASGAFLLQQVSPGLDEWNGTKAGEHYESWMTVDDLRGQIIRWLAEPAERRKAIAKSGQTFVKANFSFEMQVYKLFEDILPGLSKPPML